GRDRTVVYNPEVGRPARAARGRVEDAGGLSTVLALAEALDVRQRGTAEHSRTVARYSEAIARQLGIGEEKIERVRIGGLLHDVGKVGVPEALLSKPGLLTETDWPEIRRHPEVGAQIIQNSGLGDVAEWVRAHHERPDGGGYPAGLRGEEVPLEARILSVADAFEAMTSDRAHRLAMSHELARAELEAGVGRQWDERVVHALEAVLDQGGLAVSSRR
nr:HD-GYP domain-containing protein [Thermoleophilaceae bacterium]